MDVPIVPHADERDIWFEWLRAGRHGGDAAQAAQLQPLLDDIRDRLLAGARLRAADTVADIGSGTGMVGFAALERIAAGNVIFVDMSPALVAQTRDEAHRRGVAGRCRFIVAAAENLAALADASVDAITVRAVLAYVTDRGAALHECYRILRPGGRISIVEPIFQDEAYALAGVAAQLAADNGPAGRYVEYLYRLRSAQLPATLEAIRADPLTNYNERDLLRLFQNAGFVNVRLRLHIDAVTAPPTAWAAYLATSPRAGVASNGDILASRFSASERREFEQVFRAGIEAGTAPERNVNAYLAAERP